MTSFSKHYTSTSNSISNNSLVFCSWSPRVKSAFQLGHGRAYTVITQAREGLVLDLHVLATVKTSHFHRESLLRFEPTIPPSQFVLAPNFWYAKEGSQGIAYFHGNCFPILILSVFLLEAIFTQTLNHVLVM